MDITSVEMQAWLGVISKIAIPVVIGVAGYYVNNTLKNKDIAVAYVDIAVRILEHKENDQALRTWATQVIKKYSEVPLTPEATQSLEAHGIAISGSAAILENGSDHASATGTIK
jgi:hypothetical protein